MHFSTVLLGFAAAATAIDVRLYDNANCGGGFVEWKNVNPNQCYNWDNDAHSSAEWRAIPFDWHLNVGAYRNGGCNTLVTSSDTSDQSSICLSASGRVLTAARYHFRNNKRANEASCDATGTVGKRQQKCAQQVPPHKVGLADGSVYNIVGLEKTLVDTLVQFAQNGSTATDVPEVYHPLAVME